MACVTRTQQQRLQLRPPRGSSSFVLAAPTLLCFLCLFLAVFAQPSSCRPLPLVDHHPSRNNGVVKAAAANVLLLPSPAEATTTMVVAAPSTSVPSREDAEDRRRNQLAGGRHQWLLNKKPRGKAPPSAPSKRTN